MMVVRDKERKRKNETNELGNHVLMKISKSFIWTKRGLIGNEHHMSQKGTRNVSERAEKEGSRHDIYAISLLTGKYSAPYCSTSRQQAGIVNPFVFQIQQASCGYFPAVRLPVATGDHLSRPNGP